MKTDRELDQEIYDRQARIQAAVKDGWKRLVNQGRAAYEKNGRFLDINANPCPDPNKPAEEKPKRRGRPAKVEKVEPVEEVKDESKDQE